jgi:hypothetical protein
MSEIQGYAKRSVAKLIYRCRTKAIIAEGEQRQVGLNWAVSRRGVLRVYEDRLECGKWVIPYGEIQKGVLFSYRSPFSRIPGYILTVEAQDKTYHFGMNGWGKFWKGELPFEVERQAGSLKFSWVSVIGRGILLGYLCYVLWDWWVTR